tara:strand:- start:462 stop:1406 length:945 start_codon:yes stop_codon:yes gene_type:complete
MAATKTAKATKVWGTYLRNEIVSVKPVESSGKWSTLLVKGQEKKKDPFIYNKVKRSYQVPLNDHRRGGGVKIILDDQERRHIKKYATSFPEGMTQKEFFEKELGADLNPNKPVKEGNFWRVDRRSRVTMTKEGLRLDLGFSVDMLKYLILLSNKKLVSPSYDERMLKATYEFMIVDEGKVTSKKVELAEIKAKAYTKYAEITSNESKMLGFLRSLGRTIPTKYTVDWLKSEILGVLEDSTSQFLTLIEHPQYDSRIFVQRAIDSGAIKKMNNRRYVLDNGVELGDLTSAIAYLNEPENQEVKMRITTQIELAKK